MDLFNHFIPWTKKRVSSLTPKIWEQLFAPSQNIKQDQSIIVTNLIVLLYQKINGNIDVSTYKNRAKIVGWFEQYGRSIFNVDELELSYSNILKDPEKLIPGGVNLVGYSRGRLGLGEDIRCYASLLDDMGVDYSILHIGHPSDDPQAYTHPNEGRLRFDKSVIFLNPIEIPKLLNIYDDFNGSFGSAVAVPPWELENVPDEWTSTLAPFDEVWGISEFTTTALRKVHGNVHYAAPVVMPLNESGVKDKRASSSFRFLFIFDAGSFIERKNPLAIVQAFQQAFSTSEDVELILKVANETDSAHWETVKRKASSDHRIKIVSRLMTQSELELLWRTADCYVSLHRSEGFGRTLAEAILRKIPVITTKYSGSTDLFPNDYPWFVDYKLMLVEDSAYPLACNSRWANVSIQDSVEKMRAVRATKNDISLQYVTDNAVDFLTKKFNFKNDSRPITRWLECEKE
ncbi:glycosyltransferase [Alteromonas sp. 1_MG-2023]|uniref:glycosyltransferase n=1 Tax=Alteromonas sp. 1_MG-2023 TaxID=3062669 RepID=UPI0026E282AD|nr:glycosyltransferase [Alteromonas sp. 1_MG-2023]MDO6567891.1 glycosyltransferase [Alteromonas sp. 1_MG-2023]